MWQNLNVWKTFPLEALDILENGLPDPEEFDSLALERDKTLVRMIKALQGKVICTRDLEY